MLYNTVFTPAEIQQKLGIRLNPASFYLKELKDANVIVCLNEDTKKGDYMHFLILETKFIVI